MPEKELCRSAAQTVPLHNEDDNRIDIELAVQAAVLFGIGKSDAQAYAAQLLETVRENWNNISPFRSINSMDGAKRVSVLSNFSDNAMLIASAPQISPTQELR